MPGTGLSVVETLAAAQSAAQTAQATALEAYVALINSDSGTSDDQAALLAAAQTLGKTAQQVSADCAAVQEAKTLVAQMNSVAGARLVYNQLTRLVGQYALRVAAQITLLENQRAKLSQVQAMAAGNVRVYAGALKSLQALMAANAPLLSPVEIPAPSVLDQTGVAPETNLPSLPIFLNSYSEMQPAPIDLSADLELPANLTNFNT